jgi:hypothetical protein
MTQSTLPTRRALHAYPGPVGELVSREISAHMDALVRTGDTLVPGLVTQLLGLSPPDSHPHRNNGDRTTANAAEPHQNNRWRGAGRLPVAASARVIARLSMISNIDRGSTAPAGRGRLPAGRCQSRGGRGDSFAHPTDADYTGLAEVAWGPRRRVLLVLSRARSFVRSGNGPTRDHHEQRRRVID